MDLEEYLADLAADEELEVTKIHGFRVIASRHVPEGQIEFRAPQTGRLLGKITGIGPRREMVVPE